LIFPRRQRIHRSYELFERRTGILKVMLRISTIKIWDEQEERKEGEKGRNGEAGQRFRGREKG